MLWRQWPIALLVTVLTGAAVAVGVMMAPKTYTATAEISALSSVQGSNDDQDSLRSTLGELANSREVVADVEEELDGARSGDELRRSIAGRWVEGTVLVEISVDDRDPEMAARIEAERRAAALAVELAEAREELIEGATATFQDDLREQADRLGGVLRATGIGGAIAESLDSLGLPLIVAGFVIAAIVRMAQGSATVALTTAAALVQPAVQAATDLNAGQLAAMVLALAAGSVFAGHVNDSGFWLVSRFFGMDTATTLKTWTVGQALIGIVGFVGALAIYGVAAGIA